MALETINPTTGERLKTFDQWNDRQVEAVLAETSATNVIWQATSFAERARLFRQAAAELRDKIRSLRQQEMAVGVKVE